MPLNPSRLQSAINMFGEIQLAEFPDAIRLHSERILGYLYRNPELVRSLDRARTQHEVDAELLLLLWQDEGLEQRIGSKAFADLGEFLKRSTTYPEWVRRSRQALTSDEHESPYWEQPDYLRKQSKGASERFRQEWKDGQATA